MHTHTGTEVGRLRRTSRCGPGSGLPADIRTAGSRARVGSPSRCTIEREGAMSETPEEPLPIEDRVRELESSRRRHRWILILLVFTTCGYVEGRSTDIGQSNDVERLSHGVRGRRRRREAQQRRREHAKRTAACFRSATGTTDLGEQHTHRTSRTSAARRLTVLTRNKASVVRCRRGFEPSELRTPRVRPAQHL